MNFIYGTAESMTEATFYDKTATAILAQLGELGFLPIRHTIYEWDAYHRLYTKVQNSFVVEEGSITTLMARVLFGIADCHRSLNILVIGAGTGNAMIWLCTPAMQMKNIIGVDTNSQMVTKARQNFQRAGMAEARIEKLDGHNVGDLIDAPLDLVFLDADDPIYRKQIYCSLLETVKPFCRSGTLILAHDIVFPSFRQELLLYRQLVHNKEQFRASITLALDTFGLEVTLL